MTESRKRIEQFKKDLLKERLNLCTEKQQEFFHKIFPKGPSPSKFDDALDLIDRTILKNTK